MWFDDNRGRAFFPSQGQNSRYNDPRPRAVAAAMHQANAARFDPTADPPVREDWIRGNSLNTITYEELFTLPDDGPEGEPDCAPQFGGVYLIGLHGRRIWHTPSVGDGARGKHREAERHRTIPEGLGLGRVPLRGPPRPTPAMPSEFGLMTYADVAAVGASRPLSPHGSTFRPIT